MCVLCRYIFWAGTALGSMADAERRLRHYEAGVRMRRRLMVRETQRRLLEGQDGIDGDGS